MNDNIGRLERLRGSEYCCPSIAMPKTITHPPDSKLLERSRQHLVKVLAMAAHYALGG